MSDKPCFLDSNIWLYILLDNSEDADTKRKREIAITLTDSDKLVVSTQVINEVCVNLVKKSAFTEEQLLALIQDFYDGCTVVEINYEILIAASDLRNRYTFSFWDSLIIASALYVNIEVLYSEDMQHGLLVYQKLEIINTFKKLK